MQDVNLRLEFHRALDAVTPPAPWIGPRLREEMQRRRRESFVERARRRPGEFAWLLPAIAVLLALAIIITITLGRHFFLPIVPVRPHSGGLVTCPTWGYIPGGANAPASIKMVNATVGWAPGDLRTTDGALHWREVSPKELRAGEPFLPGQQTVYPPIYTDFFLDADHAWLVRSYETQAACIDHLAIFRTGDGGKTWRSSTLTPRLSFGVQPTAALDFFDPQHGWLQVVEPSPRAPAAHPGVSLVYRTTDGGQSWRLVSSAGPSCASMGFISPTKGFSACGNQFGGGIPQLWVTSDGGANWSTRLVTGSAQDSVAQPVFFDSSHGAALGYGNGGYGIYVTSDGGETWRQTAFAGSGTTFALGGFEPYATTVGFEDAQDFWLFATQPGWAKGGVEMDWLYHSADGGATWQLVQRDTPASSPSSISFADHMHGFVVQGDQNGATQILATSDGGHAWTAVPVQIS